MASFSELNLQEEKFVKSVKLNDDLNNFQQPRLFMEKGKHIIFSRKYEYGSNI